MEFPVLENLLRTEAQQLCSVALLRHLEPGAKVDLGPSILRGREFGATSQLLSNAEICSSCNAFIICALL